MIQLTNVKKTYENGTDAVCGINLQIDDGEFVFVVGPSGSGKSTLIKMLTAEVRPTSGRVQINGFNTNRLSRKQVPLLRRTIG
ncbi:MAG: ATP-binding cassette domain-containing protein, partial [Oscillospiraceae bacterium]|nr:ATP-binding cassette domain-containing protein [Oscillospiraceae bacterium]